MGSEARRLEPVAIDEQAERATGDAIPLSLLLVLEFLIVAVLQLPFDLGFDTFAFGDRGDWLMVNHLAARGMRPAVDFLYYYGLLPVWLSAGWFGTFGNTPYAFEAVSLLCGMTMALAIGRIARSLCLPKPARLLAVAALPFAVITSYFSIAHAVDAALLCNALAEQAAGRRANALALATAACFAKPSMGYVYGFVLLVIGIAEIYRYGGISRRRIDWSAIGRMLLPAIATGGVLALLLAFKYGASSLFTTLLPLAGMKAYAAMDFGFFRGNGSVFWHGRPVYLYFLTAVGFWLAASIWLAAAGLASLWRLIRGHNEASRRRDEFVVTVAVLHTLFVTEFFGGPLSWMDYSYILVLGAMATCTAERFRYVVVCALALAAAVGQGGALGTDVALWRERAPSSITAGLWASAAQRSALVEMTAELHGRSAQMISADGCATLLLPQFQVHDYAYLDLGAQSKAGTMTQLANAPIVVLAVAPDTLNAADFWPQLKLLLARRELVMKNDSYAVYRKHEKGARSHRIQMTAARARLTRPRRRWLR